MNPAMGGQISAVHRAVAAALRALHHGQPFRATSAAALSGQGGGTALSQLCRRGVSGLTFPAAAPLRRG